MSDLDLRQIDTILKGGKRGPAVVPGKSSESLLYRAMAQTGELKMPPGKAALPAADVETIRQWIDAGARWPAENAHTKSEPSWWAFRKPRRPDLPKVKTAAWVRTPVDAFVLRTLEEKGLKPAPPVGKAALIRRAYYDLLGLPPSPEEVRSFLADPSPAAYEKLIDRLLASPQYGERWGRHWLDVVRYADSTGFESDLYYKNAWRYRDYVIRAFNEDKPLQRIRRGADRRRRDLAERQRARGHAISFPKRRRPISNAASAPGCTRSARWIPPPALMAPSCGTTA